MISRAWAHAGRFELGNVLILDLVSLISLNLSLSPSAVAVAAHDICCAVLGLIDSSTLSTCHFRKSRTSFLAGLASTRALQAAPASSIPVLASADQIAVSLNIFLSEYM